MGKTNKWAFAEVSAKAEGGIRMDKMIKESFTNNKGITFIDCAECNKGGNGKGDYCASGGLIKDLGIYRCCCGTLMPCYNSKDLKQKEE